MYFDLGPLAPLKNFKKPQRKSVIFSKVAGRQSSTFLKASLHQRFFNVWIGATVPKSQNTSPL